MKTETTMKTETAKKMIADGQLAQQMLREIEKDERRLAAWRKLLQSARAGSRCPDCGAEMDDNGHPASCPEYTTCCPECGYQHSPNL